MLGGLARRVSYILGEKARDEKMLVVDSGNLFHQSTTARPAGGDPRVDDLIIRSYRRLGVAAINVGMTDISRGPDFFEKTRAGILPWVSSNLVDGKGDYVFNPYVIKEIENVRFGIIGLTSAVADPVFRESFGKDHAVADPLQSAKKVLRDISKKADVILLLAALNPGEVRRLAAENPGICFILGGGEGRTTVHPLRESGTPLLRSGKDGMYVGRLNLTCTGSMNGFLDAEEESRLHLELQNLEQRIAALEKARQNKDTPALGKMIDDLRSGKSALEKKLMAICVCGTETGKFTWDLVPMESDIPEDETVLDWIRTAGLEESS